LVSHYGTNAGSWAVMKEKEKTIEILERVGLGGEF
jgi:hypothetical protein